MAGMIRILVADEFGQEGLEILRQEGTFEVDVRPPMGEAELAAIVGGYDGLIVRSTTRVTHNVVEAGTRLRVVARAGIGVDNIDVDAATRRGILILNSPEGNVVAAAEHTMAMILARARNVARGDRLLRKKEWRRKELMGIELSGRTLGIFGLGHIGLVVARLSKAFGMKVIASDPFIPKEVAAAQEIELVEKDQLLARADIVTLHIPLGEKTRNFIGRNELRKMKRTAILAHCARGGIVDEEALVEALRNGWIAGAALDVFAREPLGDSPLLAEDGVVLTPHLGGSTEEAHRKVSCDIAHQMVAYFRHGQVSSAVNTVLVKEPGLAPYMNLAEKLGRFAAQLTPGRIQRVSVVCQGGLAKGETRPVTISALSGVLAASCGDTVNRVNAELVARERGVRLTESTAQDSPHYVNLVSVMLETDKSVRTVGGTLVDGREEKIVHLDNYPIDVAPAREMLILFHPDRPGMIGKVGTVLGEEGINIDRMVVGRKARGQQALMVLTLDDPVPPEILARLREMIPASQIDSVKLA